MRRLWLGTLKLVTCAKETDCYRGDCNEPLEIGKQYVQVIKRWHGGHNTKKFHIRCLQPWIEYMVEYRQNTQEDTRALSITPEQKKKRVSLARKLRYVIDKMVVADTIAKGRRLEEQYTDYTEAIADETGAPWTNYETIKRVRIISDFRNRMRQLEFTQEQLNV